ncbi:hypothetical protein O181_011834 [Austropuccinia psidii MF-1]|uniref:Uncharacterized protein n=1 Tax=Austropuccinia psidii MF-1 TaxID=1389203 RepID=A0A9Q3GM91_9BASI|nr:hypothetical protein [Austropuccinia psidii MF-1]
MIFSLKKSIDNKRLGQVKPSRHHHAQITAPNIQEKPNRNRVCHAHDDCLRDLQLMLIERFCLKCNQTLDQRQHGHGHAVQYSTTILIKINPDFIPVGQSTILPTGVLIGQRLSWAGTNSMISSYHSNLSLVSVMLLTDSDRLGRWDS